MCFCEAPSGSDEVNEDLVPGGLFVRKPAREGGTAHELERDENTIIDEADIVQQHNVRVLDASEGARLGEQTRSSRSAQRSDDLERNTLFVPGVFGFIDGPHPAAAEVTHDPKPTQDRARFELFVLASIGSRPLSRRPAHPILPHLRL